MKHILCYGDSNTWGYIPATGKRYDEHVRWTGVLADALGKDYCIHEDGLNARFTSFDSALKPFLNGMLTLPGALWAQKPLDLLIISLGTNDLKEWTAEQSAAGAGNLIGYAKAMDILYPSNEPVFRNGPKILVISPIAIGADIAQANPTSDLAGSSEESLRFPAAFENVCRTFGVELLDAQTIAQPSPVDGIHMEPDGHRALGLAVAAKVREMLGE